MSKRRGGHPEQGQPQQGQQGGPDWQSQITNPAGGQSAWQGNAPQWQPVGPPLPPAPQKQKNWFARHKVITGFGVAAVTIVVIATSASGGGSGSADATGASTQVSAPVAAASAAPAAKDGIKRAEPTKKSASTNKAAPKEKSPGVGTPVRDGKFEFTVTKVVRGKKSVGGQYLNQKAQGSYTLVYLTVKNIGDDARSFSDGNQKVMDSSGRQYEADSGADLTIENNDNVLFSQINPGNSIQGVLAFDMPVGARATSMELHDSMFSGGVKVGLI